MSSISRHSSHLVLIILALFFASACGTVKRGSITSDSRTTSAETVRAIASGIASWYGPNFHGKLTANGETFNMNDLTAAHRTLPFNTWVRVENLDTGKTVDVRINDRGPYVGNRVIDLSRRSAREVDMIDAGTANVRLFLLEEGDRPLSENNRASRESFTVQIASFNREQDALNRAGQIEGTRVEKVTVGGKTMYRVYYGIYRNSEDARDAQQSLSRNGINGFVKQIED